MNKQELYQIAFSIINHKKLRNFGTSGHVESVVLMSRVKDSGVQKSLFRLRKNLPKQLIYSQNTGIIGSI